MTDKIKEIRDRVEQDVAKGPANKEIYLVHKDRAFLLSEVDRLRAMLPPTAHSGVRNGPGEGSWSVYAAKVTEERDAARAEIEQQRREIERLKQEPELLRAELISLTNAARKSLADSYDRAREARWRASHDR